MTYIKILYVEDEPDIRNIAKIALESLGDFIVYECSSGLEALKTVATMQPDLLILDVMMPGMNGLETLEKLRELPQTAQTPALFKTAKVQSGEIQDYLATGALDVIAKPFNPMELPGQIQAIWDQHARKSA